MDTLHTVLRSIRGETKSRHHVSVFRQFLDHLDRISRQRPPRAQAPRGETNRPAHGRPNRKG